LAGAAIAAGDDPLYGLKENVIIGKLIPAGTGFVRGRFTEEELRKAEASGAGRSAVTDNVDSGSDYTAMID
jgi:hypothetical protein